MDSLIGSKVKVLKTSFDKKGSLKEDFRGDLKVIDKLMTCKSEYYKSAIMNNASFEVYVGHKLQDEGDTSIVLFQAEDIKKIY